MYTSADEHLQGARDNIRNAAEHLSAIVVSCCSGCDSYTKDFHKTMRIILNDLLILLERLEG